MALHHRHRRLNQQGLGTFALIGILIAMGIIVLSLFLFTAGGSKKPSEATNQQATGDTQEATTTSKEAPFIRIPENSLIYHNTTYKFMFAYPDGFGKLTEGSGAATLIAKAESALAVKKPVGIGTALMDGRLGAYVYKKDDFKIAVGAFETYVAPTKTGNDFTWKVVQRDPAASGSDLAIGSSYPVKTSRSQTGVTVFDFSRTLKNQLFGRWVFESGDNFIVVTLPLVGKPSNTPLTDQDVAAYKIIGDNISKTIRVPSGSANDTNSTSGASGTTGTTPSPGTSPSTNGATTTGTSNSTVQTQTQSN